MKQCGCGGTFGMRKQLHLMMGIAENASPKEMKQQYQRLMTSVFALDSHNPAYEDRLRRARERLSGAYEALKKFELKRDPEEGSAPPTSAVPKIGELLLEAGVITKVQLEAALQAQENSPVPIPIGRVFVHWRLITWDELAFYLRVQDLLKLDPESNERLTRQMLDLGLLTSREVDMLEIDCETVACTLSHAICRRGWLTPELIQELTAAARMRTASPRSPRMPLHTPGLNPPRSNSFYC